MGIIRLIKMWVETKKQIPDEPGTYVGYHPNYPRKCKMDIVEYTDKNLWKRRQAPIYWRKIDDKRWRIDNIPINEDLIIKINKKMIDGVFIDALNNNGNSSYWLSSYDSLTSLISFIEKWQYVPKDTPPVINRIIGNTIKRFELLDL